MSRNAFSLFTTAQFIARRAAVAEFSVPGDPKSKERPRHGRGHTFTPKTTIEAEAKVRAAFESRYPKWTADGEAGFGLVVHFTLSAYNARDLDNMTKLVMDALNKSLYPDDVAVSELMLRVDCGAGDACGTNVIVYRCAPRGVRPAEPPTVASYLTEHTPAIGSDGGVYGCGCGHWLADDMAPKTRRKAEHVEHRKEIREQAELIVAAWRPPVVPADPNPACLGASCTCRIPGVGCYDFERAVTLGAVWVLPGDPVPAAPVKARVPRNRKAAMPDAEGVPRLFDVDGEGRLTQASYGD